MHKIIVFFVLSRNLRKHAYETSNGQVAPQITLTTRVFVHAPTKDAAVENSEDYSYYARYDED